MDKAETRRSRAKIRDVREQRATATPFELRKASSGDYILEGYASTWQEYDCYGGPNAGGWTEQLDRKAFDHTLDEKPDLQLLINHEGMPLARTKSGTLELTTDKIGLKVRAYLDPRDPDVQALLPKMERGDMDEMSFAFRVKDQDWNNDYTHRLIREVSLQKGDVSVVNYGMNPTTKVSLLVPGAIEALAHVGESEMAELRKVPEEELKAAQTAIAQARGPDPKLYGILTGAGIGASNTFSGNFTQTLTNKKLTNPILGTPSTGTLTNVTQSPLTITGMVEYQRENTDTVFELELSNGTQVRCSRELAEKASAEIAAAASSQEVGVTTPGVPPAETDERGIEPEGLGQPIDSEEGDDGAQDITEGGDGPDAQTKCDECVEGIYCPYCGTDHSTGTVIDEASRAMSDEPDKMDDDTEECADDHPEGCDCPACQEKKGDDEQCAEGCDCAACLERNGDDHPEGCDCAACAEKNAAPEEDPEDSKPPAKERGEFPVGPEKDGEDDPEEASLIGEMAAMPEPQDPPKDDDEDDPRKRNYTLNRALNDLRSEKGTPKTLRAAALEFMAEDERDYSEPDPEPEKEEARDEEDPEKESDDEEPETTELLSIHDAFKELRGGEGTYAIRRAEVATAVEIETPEAVDRLINPPPPPEPEPIPEPEPRLLMDEAYAELRGGEDAFVIDRAIAATAVDIETSELVERLINPPEPEPVVDDYEPPVNVRAAIEEFMDEDRKRYSLDEALAAYSQDSDPDPDNPITTEVARGWDVMDAAEQPFFKKKEA